MSAIVGLLEFHNRPVDPLVLGRMLSAVAHRGPDGSDSWHEGSAGLGHQMLWTTPESISEHLPCQNAGGDIHLTADARIDNREELIGLLGIDSTSGSELSDSALILHAYERWREECVEHLLGDFAFAVWDARAQKLFCARDHFGVRPFYYYSSSEFFAFATEIKAILRHGQVPIQLNDDRIASFLVAEEDLETTFYREIFRIPPAHTLVVHADGTQRITRYWSLDPSRELRLGSDEEYAATLRELFTEAVRCRTRSAFPIGSMLSGGIDSSAITCVAHQLHTGDALHTFSTRFDRVTECDESYYQDLVIGQCDVLPHYLTGDQVAPSHDIDRIHWHQDEAVRAGNFYTNWHFYNEARQHNVRVVLDGFDGDSTISHGLGYLPTLARSGHWRKLAREVRGYAPQNNESWTKAYSNWVWTYGLDPRLSRHRSLKPVHRVARAFVHRSLRNKNGTHAHIDGTSILKSDFIARVTPVGGEKARTPYTEREAHYQRLIGPGMPWALELLNRAGGAFDVEVRFPFWDKRLVEYCLSLPPDQKISHGWTRMVMRRAMAGILPEEIQWRSGKTNMHPSFESRLRTFEQEHLHAVIIQAPELISDYVDITVLRNIHERFIRGEAPPHEVNTMWRAVCLGLWLRHASMTLSIPV